jgi:hypothetical protein
MAERSSDREPGEGGCCLWCGRPFDGRRHRGSPRQFCSVKCRHDYRTAAARWAIRALEAGLITVSDLKRAQQSARAFSEAFQQRPTPDDC